MTTNPLIADVVDYLVRELGAVDVTTEQPTWEVHEQTNRIVHWNNNTDRPPLEQHRSRANPIPIGRTITMTDNGFAYSDPGAVSAGFRQGDYEGHLFLLVAPHLTRQVATQHGPTDAADVLLAVDLTAGAEHADARFWGQVIVPQITTGGEMVLGRLKRGVASTPGRSAPWTLATPSPEDRQSADGWIAQAVASNRLVRDGQGRIQINAAAAAPAQGLSVPAPQLPPAQAPQTPAAPPEAQPTQPTPDQWATTARS